MLKLHVSMGVLLCSTLPFLCHAQEVEQTGTVAEEVSSGSTEVVTGVPEKITLESTVGDVVLPHDVHVKDVKLKCKVCHHQIRATELDTPHPDYMTSSRASCQTCHSTNSANRKKYYKCSECHPSEPDDIADETLSSKVVIHQSCWKCHEAGTGAEASRGCNNCHARKEE
jgi:c(7)-type cytochrome triheme protein